MPSRAQKPSAQGFVFRDRKSTRLNSSHDQISYAVFCLKKKIRIVKRDSEDLVVRLTPIEHLEHADGSNVDHASRKGLLFYHDEDIERITVLVQRARDKSVVSGIVHRRVQNSFFFNDTATTKIYTLSLHDALPI